mgnify:CR=1 FL=1
MCSRFLAMSLCLMVLLSGCSSNLFDSAKVLKLAEKNIPNVELKVSENKKGLDFTDKGRNVYKFTNGSFDFSIENYMSKENVLGFQSNILNNDYLSNLLVYQYTDIVSLASSYNIDLVWDTIGDTETTTATIYKRMVTNPEKAYIRILVSSTTIEFQVYLNNDSQIEPVYEFIYGFYGIIQEYLPPKKDNDLYFLFKLNFYTKETMLRTTIIYPTSIMKDKTILLSCGLEVGMDSRCLQQCYDNNVYVNSVVVNYDGEFNNCPAYIDRLFINGKEIELEDYSFMYNVEDGRYYAKVYCGVEATNKGNLVGEKVQKEILELLYPDCNYTIESGKSSSYTINGVNYKISRDSGVFVFTKNGKDLKIENYDKLGENLFNREDYQLVYINDFAEILGLQLRLIDINQGIIHLENIVEE